MPATPIRQLRTIGLLEGTSFLLLLGVAMPLKHLAAMPLAMTIAGWLHGVLWVAFCFALNRVRKAHQWSAQQTGIVFLAGLLPGGPFVIDSRLRREGDTMPLTSGKP